MPRIETTARLLDTAIFLWFLERDPLPIHLIIMAPYRTLENLGKGSGKGLRFRASIGAEYFDSVYDYLRHSGRNPNTAIGFVPSANAPILFDAVAAFERIFGNMTLYMRTFFAYFILHPEAPAPKARENLLKDPSLFLPEAITVEDAMKLGRIEFFTKLTEMFAAQYRA